MKKNEEKVPRFDDIIFENRNKAYGAYDLRRRYKSAASFSLLGGTALFAVPFIMMLVFRPEPITANTDGGIIVILQPQSLINPEDVPLVETPKPQTPAPKYTYIEPEVVDDTAGFSAMLITDLLLDSLKNESVDLIKDTMVIKPEGREEIQTDEEIPVFLSEMPLYPGGPEALLRFVAENTVYPAPALENNIQGKVFIRFVVTAKGTVERVQVMKGIDPLLDAEAVRVISTLPAWKPGRQNGRPASVWFTVPVNFSILTR